MVIYLVSYFYPINAPSHNMMEGAGCIQSWLSGHGSTLDLSSYFQNQHPTFRDPVVRPKCPMSRAGFTQKPAASFNLNTYPIEIIYILHFRIKP